MKMKIIKTPALKEGDHRVLVVRKGGDLSALISDIRQKEYVEGRFMNDKDRVHLNLLDHQLFVVRLEEENEILPRRLEGARIAAHSIHTALNEESVAQIVVVNGGVSPE